MISFSKVAVAVAVAVALHAVEVVMVIAMARRVKLYSCQLVMKYSACSGAVVGREGGWRLLGSSAADGTEPEWRGSGRGRRIRGLSLGSHAACVVCVSSSLTLSHMLPLLLLPLLLLRLLSPLMATWLVIDVTREMMALVGFLASKFQVCFLAGTGDGPCPGDVK